MSDEVAAPTTIAELACVDGSFMPAHEATIPATDEGLLRGDGAFEVIRVYDGRPFALADHLDRLERSAANLRLDDVPRSELESEIPELLEQRGGVRRLPPARPDPRRPPAPSHRAAAGHSGARAARGGGVRAHARAGRNQ